ncbi:MAG: signal peptide peptidase SppA [Edaphocola sp.]
MRQFFKFFLASLLALLVAGVLFVMVFSAIIGSFSKSISGAFPAGKPTENSDANSNSILYVDIREEYHELGEANSFALFVGGKQRTTGLLDLLRCIKYAKNDGKVKGIYLKLGGTPNGLATLQQIREALKDFKTSGKFVYAYGDDIPQRDYYVASVADSVFINPLGSVELKGLASNLAYFKGALDKLDVKPEIFYCGQFKSATEPFRMEKMSDPNRKQLAYMQSGVWQQMLGAFAEHTKADTATINGWAQAFAVRNGSDALRYHLADGKRYKDEMETLLRKKAGFSEKEKINFAMPATYIKSVSEASEANKVAVLVAEGEIVDGESESSSYQIASDNFIKEIRNVRDNDDIKAVVMRVNSPGGSALASEIILRELQLLKNKKPLVVSMGDLAASGGYYISCQADSIFALENTITGSIGVFGMMFNTQDFFNKKLGVTFDGEKNAPYADFPNLNRPMTDVEKQIMQAGVDSIYLTFKSRVAAGRKKDMAYIDSIGQGRIWTGIAALQNGLIDAIGGLDRAVKSAAAIAKLNSYTTVNYPEVEDKMEKILKLLGTNGARERLLAEQVLEHEMGKDYKWFRLLRSMQQQRSHLWMMMPVVPEIY